jgi:hypothetical protein
LAKRRPPAPEILVVAGAAWVGDGVCFFFIVQVSSDFARGSANEIHTRRGDDSDIPYLEAAIPSCAAQ